MKCTSSYCIHMFSSVAFWLTEIRQSSTSINACWGHIGLFMQKRKTLSATMTPNDHLNEPVLDHIQCKQSLDWVTLQTTLFLYSKVVNVQRKSKYPGSSSPSSSGTGCLTRGAFLWLGAERLFLSPAHYHKEITSSLYFRNRRSEFTAAESWHLSQLFHSIHFFEVGGGRTWNSSAPPR